VDTYTTADGLPTNQAEALLHDSQGRTWIGTDLGTVFLKDGSVHRLSGSMLGETYVYRFQEGSDGRIWAGARDGVFIVGRDGQIKRLTAADGLTDRNVWDMAPDGSGGMWVGSNGDGLFHVLADGSIERFTTQDGLADNFVWQVLRDSRGDIWAYTNRGLSRFDGQRFHNYDSNDGLLHQEGGATGAWEAHNGDLWFASADGLMRYDPEFDYPDPPPPNVIVERVTVGGEPISRGETLPPRAGSLDFHYAALAFWAEEEIEFRYRLRGLSNEWSDPRPYRPVTFGNLGGGSYVFEVQARPRGDNWADTTASFPFEVRPPFWDTFWFWALSIIVAALAVVLFVRLRLRRSEARRRELEAVVRERTDELEKANQQLQEATITDPLTGLHNRRFLVNQITKDIAQSNRAYAGPSEHDNRDVIFMMIDLDHFKEINDTYGHLAGDSVLRDYARLISDQLRESDYVVRWGGEEFLVVARQAEAGQCNVIAQRMIDAARGFRAKLEGVDERVPCTCSIGVSHYPFVPDRTDGLNWEQIVDIADKAVYLAKVWGRDGWVAIHGTETADIENGAGFVKKLKEDFDDMVSEGEIRLESNFDGNVKDEQREPGEE
jgi:diguanylate cyclase (GGDEF)-like protein